MNTEALVNLLKQCPGDLYIALSGGIDSLTLMRVAALVRKTPTFAVHALSAAVPAEATLRCNELAVKFGWQLIQLNAGEFDDDHYIANPVNRCYYCKSRLFDSILAQLEGDLTIATGTNTDDLGDYRPGLKAAGERDVWQPFVDADICKNDIRNIALQYGLGELSQLPAQPCLSSRIETGIAINVNDLGFVHRVERQLAEYLGEGDIRCRIVKEGVVVQLPADCSVFSDASHRQMLEVQVKKICTQASRHYLRIEPYKMGSAFLRTEQSTQHV